MRLLACLAMLLMPVAASAAPASLGKVNHIIVIYLENHSFDNLLGFFPGADGINNAGKATIQVDASGKPYATLPQVLNSGKPDPRFPATLPNRPFPITDYIRSNDLTGDLVHRFYQLQAQMNGGAMNRFVSNGDTGALTMGYYDDHQSPLWQYASRYTLADHFFTGAFGGSALNHFWLVCACTPHYDHAPPSMRATLDAGGRLLHDAPLTPDGFAVNTIQPISPPFDPRVTDPARRLPLLDNPTIGDRLDDAHIDWAWYAGGWNDAVVGKPDKVFQYHHQPFNYFTRYAPGSKGRAHLKDESDFLSAIAAGTLPPVSFYKPNGPEDWHPAYAPLDDGQKHVFDIVRAIEASALWKDSVIIVTFDDTGGFWDHVAPPAGDRFGPGERVPTLIISPFARMHTVDHTVYDTTSILKLIEERFGLAPLGERDAKARSLSAALQ